MRLNSHLHHSLPRRLRNTPVKRNDGDTLIRADLQHALLMEIFGDTTRCFHNPRPAPRGQRTNAPLPGESAPTGVHEYTPVYPYGQSKGTARKSNESEEEHKQWTQRYEEYHKNPYPSEADDPEGKVPRPGAELLTFKELYIEALLNSPRCTKAVRDKVWQDEEFAENFACVNLLINIGRMNTTLAFYAQMQTVLRSYHPLPSLQGNDNSRRHMQDAPRMKSLLKSVLLPFEKASVGPAAAPISKTAAAAASSHYVPEQEQIEMSWTLEDVVKRWQEGYKSPTSIVNFLFIFCTQASELTAMHFAQPHDAHSIFFPHKDYPIPAKDRARAFLWLCWHYLEGGAVLPPGNDRAVKNPFSDEISEKALMRARVKWDQLDDKGKRKATLGGRGTLWLGTRRSKDKDKDKDKDRTNSTAEGTAGPPVPPPIKQEGDSSDPGPSKSGAIDATSPPAAPTPVPAGASPPATEAPWSLEENDKYTHRALCPTLTVTALDSIKKENVDAADELEWGALQANDRREFMAKMAEEERQKALNGTGDSSMSGKGKGKGKGKGTATKGKGKKRGVAGTELDGRKRKAKARAAAAAAAASMTPADGADEVDELEDGEETADPVAASILGKGVKRKASEALGDGEAADSTDAGASSVSKAKGKGKGGPGRGKGKGKGKGGAGTANTVDAVVYSANTIGGAASSTPSAQVASKDAAESDEQVISALSSSHALDVDSGSMIKTISAIRKELNLPERPAIPLGPHRPLTIEDLSLGSGYHATLAMSNSTSPGTTIPRSLASLAWNRILQRTLMGHSDAAYDSDDEDVAMEEAEQTGDVFREELSRVVGCIWDEERRLKEETDGQVDKIRYPWKVSAVEEGQGGVEAA